MTRTKVLAKFHVLEIVFGPGALAELGRCALRLGPGGRAAVPGYRPGLTEAGWVTEAVGQLRRVDLPIVWDRVTPNPPPKTDSCYMGSNLPGKPRLLSYIGGVGTYRQKCDEEAAAGYPTFQRR